MLFGNFAESQSKDFGEPINEEEFTEDYGYSSDSDLEDDEDGKVLSTAGSRLSPLKPAEVMVENKTAPEDYKEEVEKGKVVKIPDVAVVT